MAKTTSEIKTRSYLPKMTRYIRTYNTNGLICAKRKTHGSCKALLKMIPVSDLIWKRVAMDIMGPLPESDNQKKCILVIMGYSTRLVIATAMKDMTANTVMRKFIKHVVLTEILSDQGKNFQSGSLKELCTQLGIKLLRTTAYHTQTDRAVEKFNKNLGGMHSPCLRRATKMGSLVRLLHSMLLSIGTYKYERNTFLFPKRQRPIGTNGCNPVEALPKL